jgi:hypothetical protein
MIYRPMITDSQIISLVLSVKVIGPMSVEDDDDGRRFNINEEKDMQLEAKTKG